MTLELGQVVAAWPLGASLAAAVAAQGLQAGRRRTALNEALHELRRPLQVLALATPGAGQLGPPAIQGSVQMAASALERLEREINGGSAAVVRAPMFARPLLDIAVARWKARAALAGGSLALRWQAGEAMIDGDRCEIAQALDNLMVNAIEHGGPKIVVEAWTRRGRFRVAVVDSGRESRPESRRESPAELVARLSGRRSRGHGLRVVRRTAATHGGEFRLHSSARGTEAVFELPLSPESRGGA
ncbi:MAG TPA: HAMP domain-containing sensor histidine kinase [Solirubrobacterales bacterium]|nr:HAMP domain-containing sensor histidine kinase [Solirubrobacterales bacterium]